MTEVIVHEMKYYGEKVNSDIDVVNYIDEYYNDYRNICCDSFFNLSMATNLDPYSFYTREEMLKKKSNVFIAFNGEEMVGSVEIRDNIIDHLFVNKKYQNRGYGKRLIFFAVSRLQEEGVDEIILYVADLDKKAINLYLKNGFKRTNTVIDNWMDNNSIIIKCAASEDIDAICDFEKQARITEPGVLCWEVNETEYKEKLNSLNLEELHNAKIIIAKQDNMVIGRCDIAIMLSLVGCEKTGYVDWIYTLKNYRGNGVGKKMLQGAENYFKSEGVNNYFLFTASNEQAHEFYHRQNDLTFSKKEVAEKEIK